MLLAVCAIASAVASIPHAAAADPSDAAIEKRAEASYVAISKKVALNGWACVGVGEIEHDSQAFAYTVGLTSKGLPEIMLNAGSGAGEECDKLNAAVPWMLAHRDHLHRNSIIGEGVRLQPVYPSEFFDRCPFAAMWVARHNIPDAFGMQMVYADAHGVYPN